MTPLPRTDLLESLERHIAADLPMLRSVVVAVDGAVVFERYFADTSAKVRSSIYSCTKSVLSMLVGVLVKQGNFPKLDAKVVEVLSALKEAAHPLFAPVTIRQCLNMTLGHVMDGSDYRILPVIQKSVDWELGTKYLYSDVGPQLISMIIQEQTGQSASEFANSALFAPLGIPNPPWEVSKDSYTVGGWGLSLTPREMLIFGQLALQKGNWNGTQLVDPAFFTQSTQRQSEGGFPGFDAYGFLWWTSERNGHHSFYALGYGGQFIFVCPDLKLVMVTTSTTQLELEIVPVQNLYFEYVMKACL